MQIDRRFTNGLAWAGAFIIVGVPVADYLSAQLLEQPSAVVASVSTEMPPMPRPAAERPASTAAAAPKPATPAAQPAKPVEPAATAAPKPSSGASDPVASYLNSGKALPSYITGGGGRQPAAVAATPKPAAPSPASTTPAAPATEVAAAPGSATPAQPAPATSSQVDPVTVAALPPQTIPYPMPLSMRPTPRTAPTLATAPAAGSAGAPVFIPNGVAAPVPSVTVTATAEDLEDWETGPLSEFLARRQQGGNAPVYYDEEPAPRRDRVVGPVDFYLFGD